jgi:hypothetical protein
MPNEVPLLRQAVEGLVEFFHVAGPGGPAGRLGL